MADFVQSNETKSAVRKLTDPIADIAAFNTIVQSVITTNPFAWVAYMTVGQNHNLVEKTRSLIQDWFNNEPRGTKFDQ